MDTWITWADISPDMAFHPRLGSIYKNTGQNVVVCPGNSGSGVYSMAALSEGTSSDVELMALPEAAGDDYYTVMSTQWSDYLAGVLQNLGHTEYVAYCLRDYSSSSSYSYIDKYILVYDLEIEGESVAAGEYPYYMIYRTSSSSSYTVEEGYTAEVVVPSPAYGSFGTLSELRKGGGINETYAILFAIGFAVVYNVVGSIFDNVVRHRKR